MKLKAAVCYELNKPYVIDEVEFEPKLQERDVLVHWEATGVCHSDMNASRGMYGFNVPFIAGHEGGGIVEEVGSGVTRVKVGDHVISNLNGSCNKCRFCLSGRSNLCEREVSFQDTRTPFHKGNQLIGRYGEHEVSTFVEYCMVPETGVEIVSKDVPLNVACILGCGALSGAGSVINSGVHFGSRVVIFGCGGLGLAGINAAKICGALQIIAVDIKLEKLELAKKFGATDVINGSEVDSVEQIKKLTGGLLADYAFAFIGIQKIMEQAIQSVHRDGKAVIIGTMGPDAKISFNPLELLYQKVVTGTSLGRSLPARDMPMLVDMYMAGKFMLGDLISHRLKLEDVNKAFDLMRSGEAIRCVLTF